jgi:hypothetical protein
MVIRAKNAKDLIEKDEISFSIEGRVVRELGERLVKEPEVALLELIKNSYDADATVCQLKYDYPEEIVVEDDGHGMTISQFRNAWMRIGTSAKESSSASPKYARSITGEKGIGRFAVRFLGKRLELRSVARDPKLGLTVLEATFNWPQFDKNQDLGKVRIPYTLSRAHKERIGTRLTISGLSKRAAAIDLWKVRTGSISTVSPYNALLKDSPLRNKLHRAARAHSHDPGFSLQISGPGEVASDLAMQILQHYVLRCVIHVKSNHLDLRVYEPGKKRPRLHSRGFIFEIAT